MQACRGGGELSAMEILEQPNSRNRERGEARRVNVVYFLSRNGRVEHPHLLRIHRLHRDRVHLSDVKRWLSEFRGKDFSDSFAWSYKRRYRGGYIWQDLRDDDLITPFSDNEYVLKGSNQLLAADSPISGNTKQAQGDTCEQMTAEETPKTAPSAETLHNSSSQDDLNSPKTPPEPDGDTSSDEARKRQAEVEVGEPKEKVKDGGEEKQAAPVTESSRRSSSDCNSCPKRVTQVVCNILRCKTAVETDDSALRPVSRQGRQQSD